MIVNDRKDLKKGDLVIYRHLHEPNVWLVVQANFGKLALMDLDNFTTFGPESCDAADELEVVGNIASIGDIIKKAINEH